MSLGAGALKVEGPIAQNGSIASEVTMATKRAPTPKNTSDPGAWRPEGPREWVPWDLRDPQHPKHPESLAHHRGLRESSWLDTMYRSRRPTRELGGQTS